MNSHNSQHRLNPKLVLWGMGGSRVSGSHHRGCACVCMRTAWTGPLEQLCSPVSLVKEPAISTSRCGVEWEGQTCTGTSDWPYPIQGRVHLAQPSWSEGRGR